MIFLRRDFPDRSSQDRYEELPLQLRKPHFSLANSLPTSRNVHNIPSKCLANIFNIAGLRCRVATPDASAL